MVIGGDDPFRLVEVPREAAVKDVGLLAAEMAALALTGGRRVVLVREATDALAPAVKAALAAAGGGAAADRGRRAAAARVGYGRCWNRQPEAAVIPCYRERGAELLGTLRALLAEAGVSAEPEALEELATRLGEDRLLLRREVEKLALYVGAGGRVRAEDVLACIGDGSALDVEEALMAATAGEVAAADRALDVALAEGSSPVGVLRAALRHVQRLQLAASGVAPEALRPPVFFRHKPAFEKAVCGYGRCPLWRRRRRHCARRRSGRNPVPLPGRCRMRLWPRRRCWRWRARPRSRRRG